MIAICSHVAPEGMLDTPARLMTYGAISIWLAAFLATYVAPMLADRSGAAAERSGAGLEAHLLPWSAAPYGPSTGPILLGTRWHPGYVRRNGSRSHTLDTA
jgi:hypothetical protein